MYVTLVSLTPLTQQILLLQTQHTSKSMILFANTPSTVQTQYKHTTYINTSTTNNSTHFTIYHLSNLSLFIFYFQQKYSISTAVVYMFNLIVGVGALSLPLGFHQAGIILGVIFLAFIGTLSYVNICYVSLIYTECKVYYCNMDC